ncbi:anaphase-promoting complex subunit 15-like [Oppia nitens]|uniref:anaphase-promoting complex subunit 15-like n=1 Tax=Oppia nitens TaxID=1686743 RepID=UPI0023DA2C92|nr:anaphase-promoting complex subunit 15-like [Oppia nitens]
MVTPLFPSMTPRYVDSNWFQVDKPMDEELELSIMEKEHNSQQQDIETRDSDLIPSQPNSQEFEEEEEEDDDNEDDDDDDDNDDDDDEEDLEADDIHGFNPDSPVGNSPNF